MIKYVKANYGDSEWVEVKSKTVQDFDGYDTDYTLYTNGELWVCMFGDSDLYEPDPDYADFVTENEDEANEWFDSYKGFEEIEGKTNEYGEKQYQVAIGNGTMYPYTETVYAYNEQEAVDKVVDHLDEEGSGLVVDYYELFDLADYGQTVDEYAEENNLTTAGNHGLYVELVYVGEVE